MIEALALIWAISASIALEAHEVAANDRRDWTMQTIVGSLLPIYNTFVAWSYARHIWNRED